MQRAFGRLLNGLFWGLLAGLALTLSRDGPAGLRRLALSSMKQGIIVGDRIVMVAAEAREQMEDLYAEVRASREHDDAEHV